MGPDLTIVLPFGNFDPTPTLAKGGVSFNTSLDDALEMIIASSRSTADTPLMIVSPDPSECARALATAQVGTFGNQVGQAVEAMFLPFVNLWSTMTLETFAFAASKPDLYNHLDKDVLKRERNLPLAELAQTPEPALQLLRIAMHMDGDRQHFFMHPDFCSNLEKVEPIINNDGLLDLLFHKTDGGLIISPVKIVCTSFIPSAVDEGRSRLLS